jgi:aspartate racemase
MESIATSDPSNLLLPYEANVPASVVEVKNLFSQLGIWFSFSRNRESRSCKDAANKRNRLGHEGIPLWDEMKSFFGKYVDVNGNQSLVLAHCRADRKLNMDKLSVALRSACAPQKLSEDDMSRLGLDYGLVNPWELWRTQCPPGAASEVQLQGMDVLQVFDGDLVQPIGTPGTVMTNAGDLTWAIELHAGDLCDCLANATRADIAENDPDEKPRLWGVRDDRPIGIITGNPPEAGMYLWQLINDRVRDQLGEVCCGDISMPRMDVLSVPEMGLSMELESRKLPVEKSLKMAVNELVERGVKLLALPCNTTSFFASSIHEWCDGTNTRFISMADATGDWLKENGIKGIGLVGINYVADLGHWSAYRSLSANHSIELLTGDGLAAARKIANLVKQEGPDYKLYQKLCAMLNQHVRSDDVVLALTELSLLLKFQKGAGKKRLIDPMQLYAEALVREYFRVER